MLRVRIRADVPGWPVSVPSGAGRLRARRLALVVPPRGHLGPMFELRFSGTGAATEWPAHRLLVRAPGLRGRRGYLRGSPARANKTGRNERGHPGRRRLRRGDFPGPRVKRDVVRTRAVRGERPLRARPRPADRAAGRHRLVALSCRQRSTSSRSSTSSSTSSSHRRSCEICSRIFGRADA